MGYLDPRLLEGYRWTMGGETPRLPEKPPQATRDKACFFAGLASISPTIQW
jgi:hypothetical protein